MRYHIIMNIAGEIYDLYRMAPDPDRAELLARISVAKEKGLIPSPWSVNPSDIRVQEAPGRESIHA